MSRARDDAAPDWEAVGKPVAALLDTIELSHPKPAPAPANGALPPLSADREHDPRRRPRICSARTGRCGFIPTYAAFNLIGDADVRGREMLMALTGLNARGYKNSTLLFSLARVFIARSPGAHADQSVLEGHRRADVAADADPASLGLLRCLLHRGAAVLISRPGSPPRTDDAAARKAIADMVDFCINISREEVRAQDGTPFNVVTALAPLPHPRFSRFFAQIKQDLGFGIYVPDCDTTACAFSAATQAGCDDPDSRPTAARFLCRLPGARRRQRACRDGAAQRQHRALRRIATWIDNMAGDRPYGNDLYPTLNLDVLEVSFRNFDRWNSGEPSRLKTIRRLFISSAGSPRPAARRSALAYLLPAGALLRLFRPLLRRVPRVAAGGPAGDRPGGSFDLIR